MDTIPGLPSLAAIPQSLSSLGWLLKQEEAEAQRVRVSSVSWWKDCMRIRGSALPKIFRSVLVITAWATVIATADLIYDKPLSLTNNVTPLLSVVVGLLLVFRNSTAYSRWEAGRGSFVKLQTTIRVFSRSVWVNVASPPPAFRTTSTGEQKPHATPQASEAELKRTKTWALRLMVAFFVATKHHVRGEYGTDWEDLTPVLPPQFLRMAKSNGYGFDAADADAEQGRPGSPGHAEEFFRLAASEVERERAQSPSGDRLEPPRSPIAFEASPLLQRARSYGGTKSQDSASPTSRSFRGRKKDSSSSSAVILHNYLSKPSLPLPLLIAHQLSLFLAACKKRGLLEAVGPAGYNNLAGKIDAMVTEFTAIERLSAQGMPTVYGVHLKQCVTLFLMTLPFTLVELMGYNMIPFVSLCAFTLMGIEGIASEIEFPFGVDDSDLPLDLMGAELRNEVEHLVAKLSEGGDGVAEWESLFGK